MKLTVNLTITIKQVINSWAQLLPRFKYHRQVTNNKGKNTKFVCHYEHLKILS